jgi:hypothetical protein
MKQALEALEFEASGWEDVPPITREAITVLCQALSEQPSHQEVNWERMYRLEVKKKEALAAKYERDTGKKLTRIVPMAEPVLRQALETEQEPVAWMHNFIEGNIITHQDLT